MNAGATLALIAFAIFASLLHPTARLVAGVLILAAAAVATNLGK